MISTSKDASRGRQRHGLSQQAAWLGTSSKKTINLNKEKFFQVFVTVYILQPAEEGSFIEFQRVARMENILQKFL